MYSFKLNNKYFIGIIIFKILLDYLYSNFVVEVFSIDGYVSYPTFSRICEGWIVYIISFLCLNRTKHLNLYISFVIVFFLIIPATTTLYSYGDKSRYFFYAQIFLYNFAFLLFSFTKSFKTRLVKNGSRITLVISVFLTLLVLANYVRIVKTPNFDLSKVYQLRASMEVYTNVFPFSYLNAWVTKVFNILLISWALWEKRYKLLVCFVVVQLLLFGYSGHKFVLLSMFIIGFCYVVMRFKDPVIYVIYGFISLLVLCFCIIKFTDNIMLPSILVRRAFFVPVNINYIYFEFFSQNDLVFWSNGMLSSFVDYPYEEKNITHVIGNYMDREGMGANTGFVASGYMQAGFIGSLIYIWIMFVIVSVVNSFKRLPLWFVNSVLLMPLLSIFINSDLLTALLTHGFLIAIVVLFLYSSTKRV